jgi:hypothetical protein
VTDGFLARVPFPIMVVVIAIVALAVEFAGFEAKLGAWSLVLLVIPGALAAVYFTAYVRLPYEPPPARSRPVAPPPTLEDEEFVDPVEEADRLEQGSRVAEGDAGAPSSREPPSGASSPPEPDPAQSGTT